METIEEKAREHCNISKGLIIDQDERYYRDFQKYDGFKAGVEFAQQWIPVEYELPEIDDYGYSKNVLVCDDPQEEEDVRICCRGIDSDGIVNWDNDEHPAYWRPIKYK